MAAAPHTGAGGPAMKYLTSKDLAEMLSTSTRSVWRMVATGRIPKPIYLGSKSPRWRLSDVEAAIALMESRK
ncbi:MAG: helix-turn-helix transcriptional regulator [Phycisphaerae bacterium]